MKGSHSRRNGSAGKNSTAVADDLIREISESVVARSTRRRGRRSSDVEPPVVMDRAPEVPVEVPKIDVPRVEAPVMKAPEPAPLPPAPPPMPPVQPRKEEPPVQRPAKPSDRLVTKSKAALAIFCYLEPECAIGRYIREVAPMIAQRGVAVHIFARHPYHIPTPGVTVHELGLCPANDLMASVGEFTLRALSAFLTEFSAESANVSLLGFEWSSVRTLLELSRNKRPAVLLSLHSLECQRSDLSSELSRKIQELEIEGLKCATSVLVHNNAVVDHAVKRLPDCKGKLIHAAQRFPVDEFTTGIDAGAVKARFHVGPIDPTILFVGSMDDRHGPDLIMKAVPGIVKNHPQARFVFVGDGPALWPMRVHARYLLLESVVRMPGHVEGRPLFELVEAADIICVPSRERTGDWPILAAWAAKKPVVATHPVGHDLKHEENAILVYPNEGSIVWGVERILFDEGVRKKISANGYQKVLESCGWGKAAGQIVELMNVGAAK